MIEPQTQASFLDIASDPVRSRKTHKFIMETAVPYNADDCLKWPYKTLKGYGGLRISGRWNGAHRIICELVHGAPPTNVHQASHSCGNGHLGCVNPKHISWKTPQGNAQDRFVHGTDNGGERNGRARLSLADVSRIRELAGVITQRDLAARYHVAETTISAIHTGRLWASQR